MLKMVYYKCCLRALFGDAYARRLKWYCHAVMRRKSEGNDISLYIKHIEEAYDAIRYGDDVMCSVRFRTLLRVFT